MSKKYTFSMIVVKPTGKGGKPLKPKEIKPKKKREGGMSNKSKDPKVKKIGIGTGKAKDYPGMKKIIEMNKKGKKRFSKGGEMLKGGQRKLDANKDGKISGEDFKLIRKEKPQPPKMIKKALGGVALGIVPDKAMKQSQTARDLAGSLGLTGQAMSKFYNKKYAGKKEGGEMTSNKRKRLKDVQNPKSEYDKKGKLKYTAAKEGGEMKRGYGAARQAGMGLQDENLTPGKTMDYYKDLM